MTRHCVYGCWLATASLYACWLLGRTPATRRVTFSWICSSSTSRSSVRCLTRQCQPKRCHRPAAVLWDGMAWHGVAWHAMQLCGVRQPNQNCRQRSHKQTELHVSISARCFLEARSEEAVRCKTWPQMLSGRCTSSLTFGRLSVSVLRLSSIRRCFLSLCALQLSSSVAATSAASFRFAMAVTCIVTSGRMLCLSACIHHLSCNNVIYHYVLHCTL